MRGSGRVQLYACIAAANHNTIIPLVLGQSRARAEVHARREVMQRLHSDGLSYSEIGRLLNRDHSTVMFNLGKIEKHGKTVTPRTRREKQRYSPRAANDIARPLVTESEAVIAQRIASRPPIAPCFLCGARGECKHR